jgi:hypothetical protein
MEMAEDIEIAGLWLVVKRGEVASIGKGLHVVT